MVDFCFKQKTAYEMRISDWSSDVCSSDLVTFTGTGIWDISRTWIALLLTGNCTDIESIFHRSVTNSEGFDLATVVGTGTGMNVAEFAEKIGKPLGLYVDLYKLVMHHVMNALGYTVTSCTERRAPGLADTPVHCPRSEKARGGKE